MKKCKYIFMMFFSFLFFFSFSSYVSAEDTTIECDTYLMKYDYIDTGITGNSTLYKNKTYTLNIEKDIKGIEYVTYEFYAINKGEELTYNFGSYIIRDGVATNYLTRFEESVDNNQVTYFVVKNYDISSVESMLSSLISESFYEDMVSALNSYIGSNFEFHYLSYGGSDVTGYDGLMINMDGYEYSYIDSNSLTKSGYYTLLGLPLFDPYHTYTFDNVSATRLSDMYTAKDLEDMYNQGKEDGYNEGFINGEASIDITSDNDTVINLYIQEHEMLTKEEGEAKYNQGLTDGKNYVYNNIETDVVVNDYIIKNYYTKEEYDLNFNLGISEGKSYVYNHLDTDVVIKNYVDKEVKETITEKTNVKIISESKDSDLLIKNYDVNFSDTGDLIINIHKGQDNYLIDKVVEDKYLIDVDLITKIGLIALVVIGILIVIFVVLSGFSSNTKQKRKGNNYVKRKRIF